MRLPCPRTFRTADNTKCQVQTHDWPNLPCICSIAGREFLARVHILPNPTNNELRDQVHQQALDAGQQLNQEQVAHRVRELRQEHLGMVAIPMPIMADLLAEGFHIRLNEP